MWRGQICLTFFVYKPNSNKPSPEWGLKAEAAALLRTNTTISHVRVRLGLVKLNPDQMWKGWKSLLLMVWMTPPGKEAASKHRWKCWRGRRFRRGQRRRDGGRLQTHEWGRTSSFFSIDAALVSRREKGLENGWMEMQLCWFMFNVCCCFFLVSDYLVFFFTSLLFIVFVSLSWAFCLYLHMPSSLHTVKIVHLSQPTMFMMTSWPGSVSTKSDPLNKPY